MAYWQALEKAWLEQTPSNGVCIPNSPQLIIYLRTLVSCDNTIFGQSWSPGVFCDNSTAGQAYGIKCSDVCCMLCWIPNFLWLPTFSTTLLPDWMNIDSWYPLCSLIGFYYLVLVVTIQVPENTCASTRYIGKKESLFVIEGWCMRLKIRNWCISI